MKKYKKTITLLIVLIIAAMMFASFYGVYKIGKNGEKISLLPDLKLGMEFGKTRVITAAVREGTEILVHNDKGQLVYPREGSSLTEDDGYTNKTEKINPDSVRTLEKYDECREIIERRLENNNISDFSIEVDEKTGNLTIRIPDDENADSAQRIIQNMGNFVVLDNETGATLLDNSHLDKAEVVYTQTELGTAVFVQIGFTEEGEKILQELNEIYVETTTTKTNKEGKEEEVTTSKLVEIALNGASIGTTVIPNIYSDNKIMLTVQLSDDITTIEEAIEAADIEVKILNAGLLPIDYDFSFVPEESKVDTKVVLIALGAITGIFVIAYIYLIIKFKAKGFISIYFQIGFVAALLLMLRLTGEIITVEGIAGIIVSMVLEYIFTYIVLRNIVKETDGMYKKANLEFFLNTFPVYVVAVVFAFAVRTHISSFGTTLFWGILLIYVYNFIFSKYVFERLKIGRTK